MSRADGCSDPDQRPHALEQTDKLYRLEIPSSCSPLRQLYGPQASAGGPVFIRAGVAQAKLAPRPTPTALLYAPQSGAVPAIRPMAGHVEPRHAMLADVAERHRFIGRTLCHDANRATD